MTDVNETAAQVLNVVVDISHYQTVSSFTDVKTGGVLGIIHKATQGTGYTDPTYSARKPEALAAGLMWGAYHFGTNSYGVAQADHFLEVVQPGEQDLLVLDVESNGDNSMNLRAAEDFVNYIYYKTGRWPVLYTNYPYMNGLAGAKDSTILKNCVLYIARYGAEPNVPLPWTKWTFWQYTDGVNGDQPKTTDGIGPCDRDKFSGTLSDLKTLWGY